VVVNEFMTIGSFSRLSGLSINALRHYDDVNLLNPADVDEATGYRRYLKSQLMTARVMGDLRCLNVPLEDVRAGLTRPSGVDVSGCWRQACRCAFPGGLSSTACAGP
jgi:DNA-binding transcriptional MerR regulator